MEAESPREERSVAMSAGGTNPFKGREGPERRPEPYPWERRSAEAEDAEYEYKRGMSSFVERREGETMNEERVRLLARMAELEEELLRHRPYTEGRKRATMEKIKIQARLTAIKAENKKAYLAPKDGAVNGKYATRREAAKKAFKDYDGANVDCLMACAARMLGDASRDIEFTEAEYQVIHDMNEWVVNREREKAGVKVPPLNKPIDDGWLP